LDFERAYCLYRLHREKEALSILEGLGKRGRKEEHLEAQIVSVTCGELLLIL
jgi:signal recognition particle subunit SRP72